MKKVSISTYLLIAMLIVPVLPLSGEDIEFMGVDEIKPGMKGYGLTVFKGVEISRFDAEILGVLKGAFPQQDMILARFIAPELEDIGVIAGMSGSPVYIDDKIIGAIAYGWGFSREAIGGITPIENMLNVLEIAKQEPASEKTQTFGSRYRESLSPHYESINISRDLVTENTSLYDLFGTAESIELEPLAAPFSISHCDPRLMPFVKKFVSRYRLLPVLTGQTDVAIDPETADTPLQPGSALGVPLMTGDMTMTIMGTATYVKDGEVLGFGHPMFSNGPIKAPMSTGYIYSIIPSIARPFKLGAALKEVGSIRQDRLPAIAGFVGETAPMIPFSVEIDLPEQEQTRTFSYHIWEDVEFSPFLVFAGVIESIYASYKSGGNNAADMQYSIELDDGSVIKKTEFMSNPWYLDASLFLSLQRDLSILLMNSFKEVHLKNITYKVKLLNEAKAAQILSARIDKEEYKPGETIEVTLWLQRFREDRKKIDAEITLPDNLSENEYTLMIMDGSSRKQLEHTRAPGSMTSYSFEQLVHNLQKNYPRNRIYMVIPQPAPGLTVEGTEMSELPLSTVTVLKDAVLPGLASDVAATVIFEKEIATDYDVGGNKRIKFRVER